MALEFKLHTGAETLGTVAEITGAGGKISLIPTNFNNHEKRVVIILKKANGESTTVTCSANVSDGLRAKKITLSQLQGFPIAEQVTPDGEIRNYVTMPSGGALIEFSVTGEVSEYKQEVFDPSELVAF
jgi:hypothetical protein